MDLLLFGIGTSFSFFFLVLSYWKEDRIFNIFGSLSLMTMILILIGTGIQTGGTATTAFVISNETDVVTNNTMTYSTVENIVDFNQSVGIGLLMFIFISLQYLYFNMVYKNVIKSGGA